LNNTGINQKISNFNVALGVLKMKLEEAKKTEAKRLYLADLIEQSNALLFYLKDTLEDFKILHTVVCREEIAFKRRRLGFLEECLTKQMSIIFPKKRLRASIACDFNRRKTKLRLNIADSNNNLRPPSKTEGKLAQQLISVTSAYGCLKLLGKNILYMDEPFSNSSEDNLIKLQALLDSFVNEGFQVILISQSPLLFTDIERRLIMLRSINGVVVDRVEYEEIKHLKGSD